MSFLSEIVGSFSVGSADNPTVAMMDAAFAAEGLDWRYLNCEVPPARLSAAVAGAEAMGWRGFNCSVPHKQSVIPMLDELSETGAVTQAINCVVARPDGGWVGHNTDGVGFAISVEEHLDPVGCDVLLVGAGGAAHAVGVEMALRGAAKIRVAARIASAAQSLAALIDRNTQAEAEALPLAAPLAIPAGVGLIVQATPVGMSPSPDAAIAIDWDGLRTDVVAADLIVADVVPNPPQTRFLVEADRAGATTIDGTGMLVNQGAENLRLWTGVEVDRSVLRSALVDAFARQEPVA